LVTACDPEQCHSGPDSGEAVDRGNEGGEKEGRKYIGGKDRQRRKEEEWWQRRRE